MDGMLGRVLRQRCQGNFDSACASGEEGTRAMPTGRAYNKAPVILSSPGRICSGGVRNTLDWRAVFDDGARREQGAPAR
jgi:hypothetical protein